MLTINADGHDVMKDFHKPEDEKRMVVVLDEADYDCWLDTPREAMPEFLTRYPADRLMTESAPRPARAKQSS
jgi:putative SOS response-associated peptidase YedK